MATLSACGGEHDPVGRFPVETVDRLNQAEKTLPVVEAFGPTIQGEGALAGLPTMFVRLGYCDYRCSWCDSMYAVEPSEVKEHSERLTDRGIIAQLQELHTEPMWVTLSGGNPAIHDCSDLVASLQELGYLVSVETQGSIWRDWLKEVDHLTVSPKPPSSKMATAAHVAQTYSFLATAHDSMPGHQRSIKVVVFDDQDFEWARSLIEERKAEMQWWDTYLSVGTNPPDPAESIEATRGHICDRYRWLCEKVSGDPAFSNTRVYPQLHVLAWSHARAV